MVAAASWYLYLSLASRMAGSLSLRRCCVGHKNLIGRPQSNTLLAQEAVACQLASWVKVIIGKALEAPLSVHLAAATCLPEGSASERMQSAGSRLRDTRTGLSEAQPDIRLRKSVTGLHFRTSHPQRQSAFAY
uniref:Putative secreted protein n=1 Tax=Amblyomma cajennense TaxID=34607 RepID=A0A023FE16_AMBCJ